MQTTLRAVTTALLAGMAAACTQQAPATTDSVPSPTGATPAPCAVTPLETRPINGTGQTPAFPGQTRGCGIISSVAHEVTVVATGLVRPWALEPMSDGSFLVTEKPGRLRIVSSTGTLGAPILGLPPVDARGQGGLLDVALGPNFSSDRMIYWSYAEPRGNSTNATSVARGTLSTDRTRVDNVQVVFRSMPAYAGTMHFGSRLAFGPDGMLYVTLGERSDTITRPQAQHMNSHLGKTVRIHPDGRVPADNPFVNQQGALPEIWTLGHRNIQAATFDSQGRFWQIEHGPRGGDEVNLVLKGRNYGWPVQAYGVEYSGQPIRTAATTRPGYEQPVYYWDPVIAPSGAEWYTGSAFPAWRNSLFVGGLASMRLVRFTIGDGRVTGEEHLLADRGNRIRDVKQGPDGNLYVVTDAAAGELWRIAPR